MIIIDASIIYDAFNDEHLLTSIITLPKSIKAPTFLLKEILGFKKLVISDYSISSKKFDKVMKAIENKVVFEEIQEQERQVARKILASLSLDLDDADYIALCLRYQDKKPTFWTYDSPFVIGDAAQTLRDNYTIFGNFTIR